MSNNRKDVITNLQMLTHHFNETNDVPSAVALSFILKDVQHLINEITDLEVISRAYKEAKESADSNKHRDIVSSMKILQEKLQYKLRWYADKDVISKSEIFNLIDKGKKLLDEKYSPDSYNIGINCGEEAGQTVMHVHVHLIPRYKGDMNDPRGGVRGVIPNKMKY